MRGDTLPKQQTCLNDPVERRAEFRLCLARYRSYQRMRELSPNPRSDLRHLLGRPEPIQPRHERSALIEALAQLTRALDQIATLPETPALRREQIKLQTYTHSCTSKDTQRQRLKLLLNEHVC
jgi:hypothetical protein